MTVVKAAAVQISPVLYSREGTVDKVVRKIIELGRQGVQFATFPRRWCRITRISPRATALEMGTQLLVARTGGDRSFRSDPCHRGSLRASRHGRVHRHQRAGWLDNLQHAVAL